ncbi:prosalusin [Engraulis encrasicolus]|uniref:prosalusin n=1 Tax=Engraulis encrasicolus TaxID=184585 RepID=UPI002FD752A7
MAVSVVLMLFCNLNAVVFGFEFKTIYCTLTDSCECDFKPNMRGLEWDLYKNLYGQHLAQNIVSESVGNFLQKENPEQPLVLSFHGASGTGKSMVSSMLGRHLYGTAMGSPFIHQFVPTLHFPLPDRQQQYKLNLKRWIEGNLTSCGRSIFIFDEMERMPPGVIDVLEPFLGPSHVVYQTNYRKAIYVFISTTGQEVIHKVTMEMRNAGHDREEIQLQDLDEQLADAAFNTNNTGFYHSKIISLKLISSYVPFLPLCQHHVRRCAQRELCQRGECHRVDVAEEVSKAMCYTSNDGQQFSCTGCKQVPAKVNVYL